MSFRISALPLEPFQPLFSLSDAQLQTRGALRRTVDAFPGFPCRVSLQDAQPGEHVLLLNFEHQGAASPYRSSHAIYVRENASQAHPATDEVPEVLRRRLLSVRAFDEAGMMRDADVTEGCVLAGLIERLFGDRQVRYLHVHNARPGCYAARIDRA